MESDRRQNDRPNVVVEIAASPAASRNDNPFLGNK